MLTLGRELNEIRHPLVKSFRVQQDFHAFEKTRKRLVIEAGFDFDGLTIAGQDQKLTDLLSDLEILLADIQKKTGRIDCVDICPGR